MKTLEERFKEAKDAVKQAQLEVVLRKKQLDELRPKRQEYEELSLTNFNVPIKRINEYIASLESEGVALIEKLEAELEKARQAATQ
jgi:NCAIR mutase (PurE)-related protein